MYVTALKNALLLNLKIALMDSGMQDHYLNVSVFKITHIELMQRRFKQNDQCYQGWKNYDQDVLNMHIIKVGCKPPYLISNGRPCFTRQEMLKSVYNLQDVRQNYYPDPCQEITNIAFTSHYANVDEDDNVYNNYIGLRVAYPGKIKLIKQSQLVDIHSLIGNIGGYIGLFLGMCKKDNQNYMRVD